MTFSPPKAMVRISRSNGVQVRFQGVFWFCFVLLYLLFTLFIFNLGILVTGTNKVREGKHQNRSDLPWGPAYAGKVTAT
jgi:hypothetical protein